MSKLRCRNCNKVAEEGTLLADQQQKCARNLSHSWQPYDPPTPSPSTSQPVHDSNRSDETPSLNGRVPVDFDYNGLEPEFLHMMAQITAYADKKYVVYGGWTNYKKARLTDEKSPINHIYAHLGNYREKVPYDHFNGNHIWHLVAIAYNAMMEFWYETHGPSDSSKV